MPVLYEGEANDIGYLVAKDTGERLRTSVNLHLELIRARKKAHPEHFAQVVRFVKWWVRQRKLEATAFKCKSFMVELIVAHLADEGKPLRPYEDALGEVFGYIAQSGLTKRIVFTDYYPLSQFPARDSEPIAIVDPVNPKNNVASHYTTADRERLVASADDAVSAITEARYATTKRQAIECWQIVFGPKFGG